MCFNNPAFIPFIAREYINNTLCATHLEILKTTNTIINKIFNCFIIENKKQLTFLISYYHFIKLRVEQC